MLNKFGVPTYKCSLAKKRYDICDEDLVENAPYPMHWMLDKMSGEMRYMDKNMFNRNKNINRAIEQAMEAFGHMFENLSDE